VWLTRNGGKQILSVSVLRACLVPIEPVVRFCSGCCKTEFVCLELKVFYDG
jgi:hypothetical protein